MLKKLKRFFQRIFPFRDYGILPEARRRIDLGNCIVRQVALSDPLSLEAIVVLDGKKMRIGIDKKNKDSHLIKLWKNEIASIPTKRPTTQSIEIRGPHGHSMGGLLFHRAEPYSCDDKEIDLWLKPTEQGETWCAIQ